MNELRRNPLTGRWVTIATDRGTRPADVTPRRLPVESEPGRPCPFCPGHEEEFPPALETYGPQGEWLVRVVPNLYPAFAGRESMDPVTLGPVFTQALASGIHEVLVLSPDHGASWPVLEARQVGLVMAAIRDRVEDHGRSPEVRYTQVIVNHGREAGASLEHPHGQLLGIPFVPGELSDEQRGFAEFGAECLLCVTAAEEVAAGYRLVYEDDRVLAICPYWSGSPYEMLILPRTHQSHLDRTVPADLVGVGQALREVLGRLRHLLGDIAYNVVFHTAPHRDSSQYHWHVHVLPRATSLAGFEQGTGVMINIVAPELAAQQLSRDS